MPIQITKCLFCQTDLEDDLKQSENLVFQRNKMRGQGQNYFSKPNTYQAWCPNEKCNYYFYAKLYNLAPSSEGKVYEILSIRTVSYIVFLGIVGYNGKAIVYKNIENNPTGIRMSESIIIEFNCSEEEFLLITEDKIKTYILFS